MDVVLRKLPLPQGTPAAAWTVLAMGSTKSNETLEFLHELSRSSQKTFKRIVAVLERASRSGPQFHNKEMCKRLKGLPGCLEFRCSVTGGHAVRILAFQDDERLIICTHGFSKKTDKTPPSELDKLRQARATYMQAKKKKQILCEDENCHE